MENSEIWKDIPGFGGHYQASSLGRIRVKDRVIEKYCALNGSTVRQKYKGRLLKLTRTKDNYLTVHISVNGIVSTPRVHRLVLMAFGKRKNGWDRFECCHNDGNSLNNRPENLRWATHCNNIKDKDKHGTNRKGEGHPMVKITEEMVRAIRAGKLSLQESGIGKSQFYRIINRERWAHVK